ncbi:MAG: hypothetical protein ACR2F1_07965 [Nitrososphaeraceae archaeon]
MNKKEKEKLAVEFIYCACGCGKTRPKYGWRNREQRFIVPHWLPKRGITNRPISYKGLHQWIRNHLPKPDYCQICKEVPPYDLANKTGIYNRDFENWYYLCRRCHMLIDGRLHNSTLYRLQWLKRKEILKIGI